MFGKKKKKNESKSDASNKLQELLQKFEILEAEIMDDDQDAPVGILVPDEENIAENKNDRKSKKDKKVKTEHSKKIKHSKNKNAEEKEIENASLSFEETEPKNITILDAQNSDAERTQAIENAQTVIETNETLKVETLQTANDDESHEINDVEATEKTEKEKDNVETNGFTEVANEDGSISFFDEEGNEIYFDEEGNQFFYDEEGNTFYIDEDGVAFYYDEDGNPFYYDEEGNVCFYDDILSDGSSQKNEEVINENSDKLISEQTASDTVMAVENEEYENNALNADTKAEIKTESSTATILETEAEEHTQTESLQAEQNKSDNANEIFNENNSEVEAQYQNMEQAIETVVNQEAVVNSLNNENSITENRAETIEDKHNEFTVNGSQQAGNSIQNNLNENGKSETINKVQPQQTTADEEANEVKRAKHSELAQLPILLDMILEQNANKIIKIKVAGMVLQIYDKFKDDHENRKYVVSCMAKILDALRKE